MTQTLVHLIALCGTVALVNRQGFSFCAQSVATGNIGVYDAHGTFYSFALLECEGFTVLK